MPPLFRLFACMRGEHGMQALAEMYTWRGSESTDQENAGDGSGDAQRWLIENVRLSTIAAPARSRA